MKDRNAKKLRLSVSTVKSLTSDDLRQVAGGGTIFLCKSDFYCTGGETTCYAPCVTSGEFTCNIPCEPQTGG